MSFENAVAQLEQTNAQLVNEVVRARDAIMGLNKMYPTITAGRDAVAVGEYFTVPGTGLVYATLYKKTGSTTQDTIAEYPSKQAFDDLVGGLGTAAAKNVATLAEALAGAAGVLPDAGQIINMIGQYGIGKSVGVEIDDADSLSVTGIFSTPSTWIGSPYSGTSSANQGSILNMQSWGSGTTYAVQLWLRMNYTEFLYRVKTAGVWSSFIKLYDANNFQPGASGGKNSKSELKNESGSPVADGATVSGASMSYSKCDMSGARITTGVYASGTWKNTSGATIANGEFGAFTKIS